MSIDRRALKPIGTVENIDLKDVRLRLKSPKKISFNKGNLDKENVAAKEVSRNIDYELQQKRLIDQYSRKYQQLNDYKQKVNQIQFELNELSLKLENSKLNQKLNGNVENVYNLAKQETNDTLEQVNKIFEMNKAPLIEINNKSVPSPRKSPTKKQSMIFNDELFSKAFDLKNKVFESSDELARNTKQKASNIFNQDDFTMKTNQFFNDLKSTLSPKKSSRIEADSSFEFDNLSANPDNMQVIFEQEIIDIDDYDSE